MATARPSWRCRPARTTPKAPRPSSSPISYAGKNVTNVRSLSMQTPSKLLVLASAYHGGRHHTGDPERSETGGGVTGDQPLGYVVLDPGMPGARTVTLVDRIFVGRECAGVDE